MPALYPDIVAWGEDLTGILYAAQSARYDRHSAAVVSELLLAYPCIASSYATISAQDKAAFDSAAGYHMAARLIGLTGFSGGSTGGVVNKVKQRDIEYTYSISATATTPKQDFIVAGWNALRGVRCVTVTPLDTPAGFAVVIAARR